MRLNTLQPKIGSKFTKSRKGKGHAAGLGKTAGRGHKGQKARSGGFHKVGFEGGQMPLQRRLPKVGFTSRMAAYSAEVRLHELAIPLDVVIDIDVLKKLHLIPNKTNKVKIILSGKLEKAIKIKGLAVTKGAREAIEAAGGTIDE